MSDPRSDRPISVAQIVTTLARGGAQATVVASSGKVGREVAVTVLAGPDTTDEGTYWGSEELEAIRTVAVPHLVRRLSVVDDFRALIWLVRWLRTNRPDIVHTHSSKAGVLGRLAARIVGIPCAHTVHGWGPLLVSSPAVRFAAETVERVLAALCDAIVVVGTPDLEYGLDRRIGRARQYRVIRSGVETASKGVKSLEQVFGDRRTVRADLALDHRFVIGMVARMSYQKDHATLIRAFAAAAIPDSTLVLIGDGPLRAELSKLIDHLGITDQVLMLGVRADAARLVAGFDISVLTSRWEGMPRTVVEAAAAGVPVVATDVGSVSELIEDGVSGLLVPIEAVEDLVSALIRLHGDRQAATAMASVAAERSEEFSAARMRSALAELWCDLAGPPAGRTEANDRPASESVVR